VEEKNAAIIKRREAGATRPWMRMRIKNRMSEPVLRRSPRKATLKLPECRVAKKNTLAMAPAAKVIMKGR
jgi:hypothetical protein